MLTPATRERLFGWRHAFNSVLVLHLVELLGVVLLLAPLLSIVLERRHLLSPKTAADIRTRCRSWLLIAPMMLVPILLGAFWTIIGTGALSLLCYREFARATGLFRERAVSATVAVGVVLLTFSVLDNWYDLFVSLEPITVGAISVVAMLKDSPQGYIQRVALGVLAFMLFGVGFAHFSYFANEPNYRPVLFWLLLSVELNDVFAYCCGKAFGHRKLMPHTSPNKTLGGSLGAALLTTPFAGVLAHFVFAGTAIDRWPRLILLGLMISVFGQLGDLLMSSVKRDLNVKDMGTLLPGHGGLLDRFDSLLLTAPASLHFIGYYLGIGLSQQRRIFSSG